MLSLYRGRSRSCTRLLLGVEVKASRQPTTNDIRGLRAFLDEYGHRVRGGIVLHGGTETYWLTDRIAAVPWWRVL